MVAAIFAKQQQLLTFRHAIDTLQIPPFDYRETLPDTYAKKNTALMLSCVAEYETPKHTYHHLQSKKHL